MILSLPKSLTIFLKEKFDSQIIPILQKTNPFRYKISHIFKLGKGQKLQPTPKTNHPKPKSAQSTPYCIHWSSDQK